MNGEDDGDEEYDLGELRDHLERLEAQQEATRKPLQSFFNVLNLMALAWLVVLTGVVVYGAYRIDQYSREIDQVQQGDTCDAALLLVAPEVRAGVTDEQLIAACPAIDPSIRKAESLTNAYLTSRGGNPNSDEG